MTTKKASSKAKAKTKAKDSSEGKTAKEIREERKEESLRHRLFAREYILQMGNATAAYRAVYGQDVKGAEVSASRLLTNANIQAIIQEERDLLQTKWKTSIDELIEHLFAVVLMDPKMVVDEDPESGEQQFKLLRHIPLQARRTLEVSGKGKSVYFRQRSGEKAIETLRSYLGLDNAGAGSGTGTYTGKDALARIRKYLDRGDKPK